MKIFFLIIIFPLIAHGEVVATGAEFPAAPLMPLVPGDPLELSLKLRHILYEQDLSERNLAIFKSYTIPWLELIPLILFALSAPFLLFFWKQKIGREKIQATPSVHSLITQMKALQNSSLPPKELAFEVAKLFKMGFENGSYMTYQELFHNIKELKRFSEIELFGLKAQLDHLEKMQYQQEPPSYEQVSSAMNGTALFLQSRDFK